MSGQFFPLLSTECRRNTNEQAELHGWTRVWWVIFQVNFPISNCCLAVLWGKCGKFWSNTIIGKICNFSVVERFISKVTQKVTNEAKPLWKYYHVIHTYEYRCADFCAVCDDPIYTRQKSLQTLLMLGNNLIFNYTSPCQGPEGTHRPQSPCTTSLELPSTRGPGSHFTPLQGSSSQTFSMLEKHITNEVAAYFSKGWNFLIVVCILKRNFVIFSTLK